MITSDTWAAIAVLNEIYGEKESASIKTPVVLGNERRPIVNLLLKAHLIKQVHTENENAPSSFVLMKEPSDITLLDIMAATNGYLDCNKPLSEKFYLQHPNAARYLGVLNEVSREYLRRITLTDL